MPAVSRPPRLVGRAAELAQLQSLCRAAADGRGRVVVLTGGTGSGRTTVAEAFLQAVVRGSPEAIAVAAVCVEGLAPRRPFGAFRDLFAQLADRGSDPELRAELERQAPAWIVPGERAGSREELFEQCIGACGAMAADRPTVLFIDDLQWCDRSSLDLLCALGKAAARFPLVLLAAVDSDRDGTSIVRDLQGRIGAGAMLELPLLDLEPAEIRELLSRQLDGKPSDELVDWTTRTTNGNPLHLTELVRFLSERRLIRRRLFKYSLRGTENTGPVSRARDVVARRIGALDPTLRWTLEAAACMGAVIDAGSLAALLEIAGDQLKPQLRAARSRELLEPVGRRGAAGYRFRHPLYRRTLRRNVGDARRARLIRRAAEEIGRTLPEPADERADEVAALYMDAGLPPEAHTWLLRAAELARRLYAGPELESMLEHAVRTAPDDAARSAAENRLAELYMATGREAEAEGLLSGIVERSHEEDDEAPTTTLAATRLGWMQMERGADIAELAGLAAERVDSARAAGGVPELVDALDFASAVAERLGRAEEALLMAEEAIHLAEGATEPDLIARAAHRLARVHVLFEDPTRARELAERALEIHQAAMDRDARSDPMAECRHLLGRAEFRVGDWDAADDHWSRALDLLSSSEPSRLRIELEAAMALLSALRGDFDAGYERLEAALQLAVGMEDPALALLCDSAAARLEYERGDHGAVLARTEAIRESLPELGAWHVDFQTTTLRALGHLELGDELSAWQEATRLEQLYQGKEGWFEGRPEGDAVRIRVIDMDADPGLASMIAGHGVKETAGKDAYGEAFLRYHLASVLARSHPDEALEAATRARELLEPLGAAPLLGRVAAVIERLPEVRGDPTGAAEAEDDPTTDEAIDQWFDGLETG